MAATAFVAVPAASAAAILLFFSISVIETTATTTTFIPADSFFLNCGSQSPVTLAADNPQRTFFPDSPFLSGDDSVAVTDPNNQTSSPLYSTARIFRSTTFSYKFQITTAGTHIVRLHFFPFLSGEWNLSDAVFNVSSAGFLLLGAFSPPPSDGAPTIKEYFLWSDAGELDLVFSPCSPPTQFAFVNAIEVFDAPPELVKSSDPTFLSFSGARGSEGGERFAFQALQTVYRVNAGGPLVTPANDTLWRTWVPDDPFVLRPSLSLENVTSATNVKYGVQDPRRTPEIAPASVYDTARTMNIPAILRQSDTFFNFNVTWSFHVDFGYTYFVRFHFCDFVSLDATQLFFDLYLGNLSAFQDLHPGSLTGQTPAAAFFLDFTVNDESGFINVSIGLSSKSTPYTANAILNGIEIMKINNSFGSLDGQFNPDSLLLPRKHEKTLLIISAAAAAAMAVVAAVGLTVFFRRKRNPQPPQSPTVQKPVDEQPANTRGMKMKLSLEDIKLATHDFDEKLIIGTGGFGKVYRGTLKDGTDIAVKRAFPGSKQGYPEFYNEITLLSQIRHRHLVSLIGYSDEPPEMILVYEYVPKGTLTSFLYFSDHHQRHYQPYLSWKQRLEICIGAARGLHYLHTGLPQVIIHRDVKSTNILLGDGFIPKVSDFGLSKVITSVGEEGVSTCVKGSFGYLDPEYFRLQKLTEKSDVYSFGVVLFEVLCARPAVNFELRQEEISLVEWALKRQRRGQIEKIVDSRLEGKIVNMGSVKRFGETAAWCLAESGGDRPAMGNVLWNLEYALHLEEEEMTNVNDSFFGIDILAMPSAKQENEDEEEERE